VGDLTVQGASSVADGMPAEDAPASEDEARIELATSAAQIGIWDWDLAQNSLVYSAIGKAIFGLPADRPVRPDDVVALTHPEDLPRTMALMQRALDPAVRDDSPYEYRIVRPDGEVRHVAARGHAVFESGDDGVRAVRYVGAIQDVTERRRLEEENRAFTARLRVAMQAGRMGSFEYDLARGVLALDRPQREILGLPDRDGPYSVASIRDLIHPDDRETLEGLALKALETGGSCAMDFRVLQPSGAIRWCGGSASVIRDGFGKPSHVFGYSIDITERRQTETELAEREAMLQSLLDAAGLFIAVVEVLDDGYAVVMANKSAAEFYDMPPGPGHKHARDLGDTDETIAARRAILMDIYAGGAPRTMEHGFTRKGENVGWCIATYTPLALSASGRPRLSAVLIDITDRKLADERQQLLMREVDHRAKNALAVAQAVVELTKETDPADFKRAVVGRVAAIARTHSLLADGHWSGVDLHRLVTDELAPYAIDKAGQLTIEGPAHSLAPATAQLIGLIVHELATNAVKHGGLKDAEGRLEVRWAEPPGGPLEFVWREFASSATPMGLGVGAGRPEGRGFGFRLLEQTISRQLGGTWQTEWGDHGLVFTMALPLDSSRPMMALAASSSASEPVGPGRRVLVIEDEPLIALETESLLEDLGFFVAGRGATLAEAWAVADERADIAILDVNLAGETSFALAQTLRRGGARVIFCTGYAGVDLPPGLEDAPVLVKPVRHEALAAVLQGLAFQA
jgi:PAS domain S-box-containing protein